MAQITVGKYTIEGSNHQELLGLKNEIFGESIYFVDITTLHPFIIDAGAHVGLATLYFKQQWPGARIIAVEPLPQNVEFLRHNIWQNHLDDVEVFESALATKVGETSFYFDQTDDVWLSTASFQSGAWDHSQTSQSIRVRTITIDSLLLKPVDLLKIDIEGAEIAVLRQSKLLHHVQNLVIELHPPNHSEEIEKIFRKTHSINIVSHHHGLKLCYLIKK